MWHIQRFERDRERLRAKREVADVSCGRWYAVPTISRLLKITGLFCKRALQKRLYKRDEKLRMCHVSDVMGWLRLVGSLKLHVSFAKEPYTRDNIRDRSLLQKSPIQETIFETNSAIETWNFKEPTNHSHPVYVLHGSCMSYIARALCVC